MMIKHAAVIAVGLLLHLESRGSSDLLVEAQPTSSQRIGFYSGTFDPPHAGHLALIREAVIRLGLHAVIVLPTPNPPLKPNAISFADRQIMARLAFAGLGRQVETVIAPPDLAAVADRSGIPGVIDALAITHAAQGQVFQIMGADALDRLLARTDWIVPENFSVVVADRAETREFPPASPNGRPIVKLNFSTGSISSTEIRASLKQGQSHPSLSPVVAAYAAEQGLYGATRQSVRPVSCWASLATP